MILDLSPYRFGNICFTAVLDWCPDKTKMTKPHL